MKIDDPAMDEVWRERDDLVYRHVSKYLACITKASDDAIRREIIDYARQKSLELDEEIQVIFMDEEKVNRIIDLGIKEYLKEEEHKRWRGRDWFNT